MVSYETDTDYCVLVTDDGAGFDTSVLIDEKKHLGLRNIRERLRVLLGAQKKMQKIGSMKLINVCEEVMAVFEMTGFVIFFRFA